MANTEFIDFSYGGQKASNFHLYRVSDGSRYNDNLIPTLTDKTAEIPGADGMYFFNTYYKQRQFSVNFAYDSLTETDLRNIRNWLNGKEIKTLIFDETPDKQYYAKVTGSPSFKYIAFDQPIESCYSSNINILHLKPKAQISVPSDTSYIWQAPINGISNNTSFTSCSFSWDADLSRWVFDPSVEGITTIKWNSAGACTAQQNTEWIVFNSTAEQAVALRDWFDLIVPDSTTHVIFKGEGTVQFTCYDPFGYSTNEFTTSTTTTVGGTAPTPFKVEQNSVSAGGQISVSGGSTTYTITIANAATNVVWNSATGMVKGTVGGVAQPLKYTGNGMALLEPGVTYTVTNGTLKYRNRYI